MRIAGTGSIQPSLTVTNQMLEEFLDTTDEWIVTRTGIKQRQIISSENLEDLAAIACQRALEEAKIDPKELDFIICSNVVNEYVTPAMSCMVQGAIGATCPCIDLNGACAGFIYALDMADAYFKSGRVKKILVVCAEEPTKMVSWENRSTCVLFGDAAAAVVLTNEEDNFKSFHLSTTSKTESLYQQRSLEMSPFFNKEVRNHPLYMNGKDIFRLAVYASMKDIRSVMEQANLTEDDIDFYLIHQANQRIIDSICENLNQDPAKFPHNVERTGNTSSASVALLLDELNKEGKLKRGDKLIFSAFGAGFTTGACLLYW